MGMATFVSGAATAITSATTTVVRNGAGRIIGFFVASGTAPTVQIFDNGAASGTVILPVTGPLAVGWYPLPVNFGTGLTVVTGGTTPNVTIVWMSLA